MPDDEKGPHYYIAYVEGYQEPVPLKGPFWSYDNAVEAHFKDCLHAMSAEEEKETRATVSAHQFYLEDDAVRIAKVERVTT